ncbi:putative alpha-dehydro-beta-deoxy-D-glucarate aldolase, Siderophore biosynthesis protein SbnG [Nitrospina gracilis 3/211]|uniref:Putative alpha-dehydro-beta-deoxy-D-glucarate aldolase, Siderophore biosynthesis protein SbnG n=1 Tax=Nitrospina gracilis (strain 3/211) TaxID=1266370 RepID=M1YZL0_NITG3|nr:MULTISPECIES: aldolase/citrate lyase family protein [Nitrospina]MCF8723605.1 4-hydroxy-2-oxoheptanedioate aldolase [Nitrospina sp. Nb-3]CCQ90685.1 putative alpha-dehydro-beta-deoxy-D-glucarate aldolase, Siderophore biosynthesis protein SbnG [Nitrospina gracilis 3/211]
MLKPNGLKRALQDKTPVAGLFCSTPSPLVVEMIGCAGFDFVILDTEHVLLNPETLANMIRAAEGVGLTALVRVPANSPDAILHVLDAGAQGVVVPRVNRVEDIERAARASRYHPHGNRGLNGGRMAGFGKMDLLEYIQAANEEVMVVAMIEEKEGLRNLPAILSVPGIDMVLEGAADLSQSLGIPWQTRSPEVRQALMEMYEAARQQDIPFCAIPRAQADLSAWRDEGVHVFVLGDERSIAARALRAEQESFMQALNLTSKESHT